MFSLAYHDFKGEANAVLARLQIPYRCYHSITSDGTGNCFFAAVLYLMQLPEIKQSLPVGFPEINNSHELRQFLISFIRDDIDLHNLEAFQLQRHFLDRPFNDWLTNMARDGTWADDFAIFCLALFLRKDIKLATDQSTTAAPWVNISATVAGSTFQSHGPQLLFVTWWADILSQLSTSEKQ